MIGTPKAGTVFQSTVAGTPDAIAVPSNIAPNDLFILACSSTSGGASYTLPSGWTQIINTSSTGGTVNPNIFMAYIFAVGTETGTYSVTHTNATSWGQILSFSGVDTNNPFDVAFTSIDEGATSTSNVVCPSQTIVTPGAAQVAFGVFNGSAITGTAPSGFTETGNRTTGVRSAELSYILGLSAGASGTRTIVSSATVAKNYGVLLALRPAPVSHNLINIRNTVMRSATR